MSDDNDKNKDKKKTPVLSLIEGMGESKPTNGKKGASLDKLRSKSKPKEPPKRVEDILGKSIANVPKPPGRGKGGGGAPMDLVVIDEARKMIEARKNEASSDLAMLRIQTDSLSECVQLAAEIYKNMPMPDHA